MNSPLSTFKACPVAIVGMSARLPGGPTLDAYWALLREGRSGIGPIPADRFTYEGETLGAQVGGFLDDVRSFDWKAFRIPPKEASRMDPQQRLMLELASEAFDDAAIPRSTLAQSNTSVHVGVMWDDHLGLYDAHRELIDGYTVSGSTLCFIPNRISYAFDLRGPSAAVDASCASSLVAIHEACRVLQLGESDLALCGGVNLMLSAKTMKVMERAGVLSPAGACRSLSADGDGFVRGEGGGCLVLRRLEDVEPGERVYAVIHGTAVNHNGRGPWVMAPSESAQARVISDAWRRGGEDGCSADYVELHGTGFTLGDAVETRALASTLGTRESPCRVGAVKANLGNLEAASGIASIIKVALSLHHGELPPTINISTLNPEIEALAEHVVPQMHHESWPESTSPSAGISATSYSGTNAHVRMLGHEAPNTDGGEGPHVVVLSGNTEHSVVLHARALLEHLAADDSTPPRLVDLTHTLWKRGARGPFRTAFVAHDTNALRGQLRQIANGVRRSVDSASAPALRLETKLPTSYVREVLVEHGLDVDENTLQVGLGRDRNASVRPLPLEALDRESVSIALAECWEAGVEFSTTFAPLGSVVSLPSIPWERQTLWLTGLHDTSSTHVAPRSHASTDYPSATDNPWRVELRCLPSPQRSPWLAQRIASEVERLSGYPKSSTTPSPSVPFFESGLTSVEMAELRSILVGALALEISPTMLFYHPSPSKLAAELVDRLQLAGPEGGAPSPTNTRPIQRLEDVLSERVARILGET